MSAEDLLARNETAGPVAVAQAEVAVGNAFKTWAQSDVGRYIIGRAERDEISILRQLAKVPAENSLEVIRLQIRSEVPGQLLRWIEEAIQVGEIARFRLEEAELSIFARENEDEHS